MVQVRERLIPLLHLGDAFGIRRRAPADLGRHGGDRRRQRPAGGAGGRRAARQAGSRDRSLGDMFRGVRGIAGGAILGDGRIGLILDTGGLLALGGDGRSRHDRRCRGTVSGHGNDSGSQASNGARRRPSGGKYLTFMLGPRGVRAAGAQGARNHQGDGHHARAAGAGARARRDQPARQGHSGDRSAAQVRLRRRRTTPSGPASSSPTSTCRRRP